MCFKQTSDIAVAFLEKQIKGEVTEGVEVTDELLMLLRDKNTLSAAITGAHDAHMMVIDDKEDELGKAVKSEHSNLIDNQNANEARRHRNRIAEIQNFFLHQENSIREIEAEE